MFLYKVKVEDAEFRYDVFSEFAIIAESEEKVIEIVQKEGTYGDEVPEYLNVSKLKIEKVADVINVKPEYEDCIISCNYINS